ncbi:MAG TPA: carboxylating nicotinate-nucleotide diphosphorylase [Vicinamibacterales bacterium]|nr:carboxylating nicotinate-nucleotide diphosphorylase [Vicinamibacterales bacterium]
MTTVAFAALDADAYRDLVRRALAEDIGQGDVTTEATIDSHQQARGVMLAKSSCVIAGLDVASEAFRQLDPSVAIHLHHGDGARCAPGVEVAEIRGRASALLTAERTALNFLQRLTAIATLASQFVDAAAGRITVLDTRKTTPLMRVLEKYAVRVGGAVNHRFGLSDGILIKDNHVRLAGGVCEAVTRMRAANPRMPIEIEAQSLEQVREALQAKADIILLDNLSTPEIIEAVKQCRGTAKTEISGGVTLARMPELAATGADFVSIGALTHSAPAADLSFEIEPE